MGRRKSIMCFLQAMEGCQAVVELRNDDTLRGRLTRVDDDGGVTLADAAWRRAHVRVPAGVPAPPPDPPLPSVYVRGTRIRFIHLPPGVDPPAVVEAARAAARDACAAARRDALTRAHAEGRLAKGGGGGEEGE